MGDIFQRRDGSALFVEFCVPRGFIVKPDGISEGLKFAVRGKNLKAENVKLRHFFEIGKREKPFRFVEHGAYGLFDERFREGIAVFLLENRLRKGNFPGESPAGRQSGACREKKEKEIGQAGTAVFSKRGNCNWNRLGRKDRRVPGFQKVRKQFLRGLISFVGVEHRGFGDDLADRLAELHKNRISGLYSPVMQ